MKFLLAFILAAPLSLFSSVEEDWSSLAFEKADRYFLNKEGYSTRIPSPKELEGTWFLRRESRHPDRKDHVRQMRRILLTAFKEKQPQAPKESSLFLDWRRDGSWMPRIIFKSGKNDSVEVSLDLLGLPLNKKGEIPMQLKTPCRREADAYACETGFKYRQETPVTMKDGKAQAGGINAIVDVKKVQFLCRLLSEEALLCSMRWQYKAFYWPEDSPQAILDALNWKPGTSYQDAPHNEASYYALYLRK